MSDLNERVIEAVLNAVDPDVRAILGDDALREIATAVAEGMHAAINAVDTHRAEQGFVLVRRDDLAWVMKRADRTPNPDAYHRLTAALGDGTHGMEGE